MSRTIEVDSELLLFALKYSITDINVDKDKVTKNIVRNIHYLNNDELSKYINVIESNEALEIGNSEYTWSDLKDAIEKEIYCFYPS